jgi:hypothetical protein
MRARHLVGALASLGITSSPLGAQPRELRVWTARALGTVLAEVGGEFEKAAGFKLNRYQRSPRRIHEAVERRRTVRCVHQHGADGRSVDQGS